MRSLVQKVFVDVLGRDVEMEIFDTLPEEIRRERFVGVFELDGVVHEVRGPFTTSCQIEASQIVAGEVPAEYPVRRFPHVLPPYHVPIPPEEEEESVA